MKHIEYLLTQDFFNQVVSSFEKEKEAPKKLIVVEHAVINSLDFINYLSQHYEVYFIPKPKSISENVLNELDETCTILKVSRNFLASKDVIDLLEEIVQKELFAIIDIGGYFAPRLLEIQDRFKTQLLKVIEDTENGQQKYEKILNIEQVNVPVLSVARSPLKLEEDYLVGHEIVIKSEIFLANYGTTLLGKKALVIGFGKIGSSIAGNLRNRGVIVSVSDYRSIRQADALARGFSFSQNLYKKIPEVDMVYIANGEKSVDLRDLESLKLDHSLYVFSATSSEDTFSSHSILSKLPVYGHGHSVDYKILKSATNKDIFFANSGNAINFTYTTSTLSEYVQLTQAEMAVMLIKAFEPSDVIHEMDEHNREVIARIWLSFVTEKEK